MSKNLRVLSLILAVVFLVVAAGCGGGGAPAAAYVPMGPVVRVTRGKTTEAVPVGKK